MTRKGEIERCDKVRTPSTNSCRSRRNATKASRGPKSSGQAALGKGPFVHNMLDCGMGRRLPDRPSVVNCVEEGQHAKAHLLA